MLSLPFKKCGACLFSYVGRPVVFFLLNVLVHVVIKIIITMITNVYLATKGEFAI